MNKKFFFIAIVFAFAESILAQTSSVIVNARAQEDKIVIRWAVDSPVEWQKANTKGFALYKMLNKLPCGLAL